MAFDVQTYSSEEQLAAALQANVNTYSSEEALQDGINLVPDPNDIFGVLAKGAYFTLIDTPLVAFTSLRVVAKGLYFTVILET